MACDDLTEMGGMQGTFLTTHWSLIEAASEGQDRNREKALIDLLLKHYWKPVYCYLRRKGYNNEEAKDLTQGFFHDVVLGHNLVQKADQAKGPFRAFLLMALNHRVAGMSDTRIDAHDPHEISLLASPLKGEG